MLRGQGEQEAIRIVAEAFNRDLRFFDFWRSMQAYREAFSEGNARMVMTPDSQFFRFFRGSSGEPEALTTPQAGPAQPPATASSAPVPAPSAPAPAPQ